MKRSRLLPLGLALLFLMLALSGCAKKEEPTAQSSYEQAIVLLQEGQYQQAVSAFEQLGHYYDASEYAMYCRALLSAQKGDHAQAAASFLMLGDFMDSRLLAVYHEGQALESMQEYEKALPMYQSIAQFTDAAARADAIPGLILERDYQKALTLEKNGQYQAAIQAYQALNGYSDSQKRIAAIYELLNSQAYAKAQALMEKGELSAARDAFLALGNYKDSPEKAKSCAYDMAKKAEENQELEQALALYIQLGDYLDSKACAQAVQNKIWENAYQYACLMEKQDQLVEAYEAFLAITDYKDAAQKAEAIREEAMYRTAFIHANKGEYKSALEKYQQLGSYKDAEEKARLVKVCTLSSQNQPLAEGVIAFQLQNAWGFVDLNHNRDIAPVWQSIRSFNTQNLSIVFDGAFYGLIDLRGQVVLPCIYSGIAAGSNGYFTASQKQGSYNYTFSLISPEGLPLYTGYALGDSYNSNLGNRYNSATLRGPAFAGGTIIAQDTDKTWCLLNQQGEKILSGLQSISYCSRLNKQDTVKAQSGNQYWLVSLAGEPLHKEGWLQIDAVGSKLIRVQHPNKLYGFIRNEDCQTAIEPQYENARAFAQNYAAVQLNDRWGFINEDGRLVIDAKYESVADFSSDRCFVIEPTLGVQIIGRQGELLYFKENVYAAAETMDAAGRFEDAIAAFESLNGYGDSQEKALLAREKINTTIYASAEALLNEGKLLEAAEVFDWLGEYADSKAQAENARNTYYEQTYAGAQALEEAGDLEGAIAIYLTLGDYHQSAQHAADLRESINQGICRLAADQEAAGQFEEAIQTLNQIPAYNNVPEMIAALQEKIWDRDYTAALALEDSLQYEEAIAAFEKLLGYRDAADCIARCQDKILLREYRAAEQMEQEGRFADAYNAFIALGDYSDSAARALAVTVKAEEQKREQKYQAAVDSEANGDLEMAKMLYTELGAYRDCKDKIAQVEEKIRRRSYDHAVAELKAENFAAAADAFLALGSYEDSMALLMEAQTGLMYQAAVEDALNGKLKAAYEAFVALGNYKDSATKAGIMGNLSRSDKTKKIADGVLIFEFHKLWGIANMNTNVITPAKYTSITFDTKSQYSKLGLLKVFIDSSDDKADTYGYINMNGHEVIPCKYIKVSDFNENGLCTVATLRAQKLYSYSSTLYYGFTFGLMNSQGKTISSPQWRTLGNSSNDVWDSSYYYSSYCKVNIPNYSYGRIKVQTADGTWGFIDENGKVLGVTTWKSIGQFTADGMALVQDAKTSKYGFINEQGQTIGQVCWDAVNSFSNGYAAVKQNNLWGFINKQNQLVIPCQYKEVSSFRADGTCDVKTQSGTWQIIDTHGNVSFFGK